MASTPSGGNDDEHNPFVAFRRFADEQISSVFHGLADIPSAFGDLRKRLEESESNANQAWQKFNAAYERATSPERRQTERDLEEERVTQTPVAASPSSSRDRRPRMQDHEDSSWVEWHAGPWSSILGAYDGFGNQQSWRPSLHFLFHSHYSPLRLESQYPQQDKRWRQAFEDLLSGEKGEKISKANHNKKGGVEESPSEWLGRLAGQNLVRQGPFGAMIPRVDEMFQTPEDFLGRWLSPASFPTFKPLGESDRGDRDFVPDEPHTELQLYEHFLGRQSEPSSSQSDETRTSIVATMTTTERRMLPDGTVTTKIMLKKRFADGSEESEETTNTTHAPPKSEVVIPPPTVDLQTATDEKPAGKAAARDQPAKANWFWSSSG